MDIAHEGANFSQMNIQARVGIYPLALVGARYIGTYQLRNNFWEN